jgi:putative sterol carrier protein
MTDPTARFFEELGQRGHAPMLANATGTVRCDIVNGKRSEHWFVTIDKGDVSVSREGSSADCTLAGDKKLFDALTTGEASPVAAVLRGTLAADGDMRLLVLFRRLLPASSPAKLRTAPPAGWSQR